MYMKYCEKRKDEQPDLEFQLLTVDFPVRYLRAVFQAWAGAAYGKFMSKIVEYICLS